MKKIITLLLISLCSTTIALADHGQGKGVGKGHGHGNKGNPAIVLPSDLTNAPPGIEKGGYPPGLAKKGKVPPGWSKGEKSGWDDDRSVFKRFWDRLFFGRDLD
jgi:hypothetical protein